MAKTQENLKAAFAGESQAHMKYLSFADKAEKEGFRNVARLFTAIAFAEKVHATNHHRVLHGNDPTLKNLETAISGEDYEVKSMYPDFIQAAQGEKETKAIQSMHFALEAEKTHSKMYGKAKEAVKSGKDTKVGVIYVCEVCGHTVEDHAPDTCPVCNARKERFRKF